MKTQQPLSQANNLDAVAPPARARVLIMHDGAYSASPAPYFLSNPADGAPFEENGAIRTFRYAAEAADYAKGVGFEPVDCTPPEIKGEAFCQVLAAAIAHNEALERHGTLTETGNRWCAACNREHGRSFVCASYSPEIRAAIDADQNREPLPYGVPGNGISQILTPISRRAS